MNINRRSEPSCPFPPHSVLARVWRRSHNDYDWRHDYPAIVNYMGARNDKGYSYDGDGDIWLLIPI